MIDDLRLADRDVDDAKGLMDLKKRRDVQCRNRDGAIPACTARIYTTNWPWAHFWPPAAFHPDHMKAITRRILWVDILADLRLDPPAEANVPAAEAGRGQEPAAAAAAFSDPAEGFVPTAEDIMMEEEGYEPTAEEEEAWVIY